MKKIYLLVLSGFLGTVLMAQQATNTDAVSRNNANNKKETKSNSVAAQSPKGNEVQSADISGLPGFPAYVNTGNKELDNANYKAAKEAWINENRALYDAYLNQSSNASDPENLSSMPGYPQYVNTGDPVNDKSRFDQAREQWIYDYKMSIRNKN